MMMEKVAKDIGVAVFGIRACLTLLFQAAPIRR